MIENKCFCVECLQGSWLWLGAALLATFFSTSLAGRAFPITSENFVIELFKKLNPRIVSNKFFNFVTYNLILKSFNGHLMGFFYRCLYFYVVQPVEIINLEN